MCRHTDKQTDTNTQIICNMLNSCDFDIYQRCLRLKFYAPSSYFSFFFVNYQILAFTQNVYFQCNVTKFIFLKKSFSPFLFAVSRTGKVNNNTGSSRKWYKSKSFLILPSSFWRRIGSLGFLRCSLNLIEIKILQNHMFQSRYEFAQNFGKMHQFFYVLITASIMYVKKVKNITIIARKYF